MKLEELIGVIFDFNGTMLFDSKYHISAWQTYIEELTGKKPSNKLFEKQSPKNILEQFLGYELSDDSYEQLSEEKEHIYRQLLVADKENVKLADGLEKFLDFLTEHNIPKTIATSANLSNVMYYFETFDLYRWFDTEKLVCKDNRYRDKPYPDMYLVASKMINIAPEKCLVFEDSDVGILAAVNAGIKNIVLVTGDRADKNIEDIKHIKAKIDNFTELKETIEINNI